MTDTNRNILLTQDQSAQVSAIGSRFECAWQQGQQPTIEAIAAGVDSHIRPALLQHLAELDIQCRVDRGSPVALDTYLARWPDLDRSELKRALESAQKNSVTSLIAADRSAAVITSSQRDALLCSSTEFLQRLRDSRLLPEAELPWPATDAAFDEPARLIAQRMVDANQLTSFQAELLLDREGDPLTLDEYVVQDFVGRGGMGTVYRAVHRRMKRTVALKVLRRDIPHSDILAKRFLREVEVAAKLCHPNIVTAYDAGEHNGVSYLVCEFVEGQNLSELVRQYGPLSLPLAVDIIQQAARALEYVHSEGIIHRDIKPSNLLLDDAGNVKLLDVGLARITQPELSDPNQSTDLTATGMIMGTVDYMSPEQALNAGLANEQSDLYSLGCTLYFLITGRVPFSHGTGFERLLAHREQAIPSLRILCGQIPSELDSLLAAMLAKKPADRIASMTELGRRLEELKSIGLPDVTLPLRSDDEPTQPTACGTRTSPDGGPAVVGMPDPERPGQHESPEHAAGSTWIAPAAPPMDNEINSLARRIPRSQSSSGWLWVLAPGLLALAVVAWIMRPDPAASHREAAVIPELRPDQNRSLASPLTDMSEDEVRAYRTDWASRLKVSERRQIGGIAFVLIPPGRFVFGEAGNAREVVRIPAYWMSETEVTTAQFRDFVNATPGFQTVAEIHGTGWGVDPVTNLWRQGAEFRWDNLGANFVDDDSPATSIAYPDASAFCKWMSSVTQKVVRLPTEEEWEFACRCGRPGNWCFGDDRAQLSLYAWHLGNSENRVHSVRQRKANAWGLYDMHGNESEWILAPAAAERNFEGQGLVRGGGFYSSPEETASSAKLETELAQPTKGAFRVLMEF